MLSDEDKKLLLDSYECYLKIKELKSKRTGETTEISAELLVGAWDFCFAEEDEQEEITKLYKNLYG